MKHTVIAPIDFIPKYPTQDISIMGPIFDQFENDLFELEMQGVVEVHKKNAIESNHANRKNHLDVNTRGFYQYHHRSPWIDKEDLAWQTLARWRYQNDDRYQEFKIWLFAAKKYKFLCNTF